MSTVHRQQSHCVTTLGERLGLACHVAAPGFLEFVADGERFFVRLDAADPAFLRLGLVVACPRGTDADAVDRAATRVNLRCPGVKATLTADHARLVLAAELVLAPAGCLPDAALLAAVVHRMTGALVTARRCFRDELGSSTLAGLAPG